MTAPIAFASPAPAAATPSGSSVGLSSSDRGFSFHDLLSIINPLQHIPIVSTIYRAITGDKIGPAERIAGDTLYGGFWGFVSSVANVAFQEITGKDFGDTALALLEGDGDGKTAVAANASSAPATTTGAATNAERGTPPAPASLAASVAPAKRASNAWIANGPPRTLQPSLASSAPALPVAVALKNATPASGTSDARSASGPPRSLQPRVAFSAATTPDNAATLALMSALNQKGVDASLGQRALSAYRRSLAASPAQTAPAI